jgi:hypothetical protein
MSGFVMAQPNYLCSNQHQENQVFLNAMSVYFVLVKTYFKFAVSLSIKRTVPVEGNLMFYETLLWSTNSPTRSLLL